MASVFVLCAAVLWLVAAVAVIRAPRFAAALYLVSALICAAGARTAPDLWAWAAIAIGLAILSFRCRQIPRSLCPVSA